MGRAALARQHAAYARILHRDYSLLADLPQLTRPLAVTGRGIARAGAEVFRGGEAAGWVTSGTAVPYWSVEGDGLRSSLADEQRLRSIALAYLDSRIVEDDAVDVQVRGGACRRWWCPTTCAATRRLWRACHRVRTTSPSCRSLPAGTRRSRRRPCACCGAAIANHEWRQEQCINLIPSEMTPSPMVRLLSVMDPAFRYAEHKKTEAFYDLDVFYYQGTEFIDEVERLLAARCARTWAAPRWRRGSSAARWPTPPCSARMLDYLNRGDRKAEPRRIAKVMNNHIGKGGHLSAQPMGALRGLRGPRPAHRAARRGRTSRCWRTTPTSPMCPHCSS